MPRTITHRRQQITDDRADIDPAYRDAEGEVSNHPPLPHAIRQKDGTTIPFKESSAPTYLMGAKDDRDVTAMRGAGGDLLKDLAQRKVRFEWSEDWHAC